MYVNALYDHGLIGGKKSSSPWVRPSDWPAMPTSNANQLDILSAVWNSGSNYCALLVVVSGGTYTVDWGDGTAPQTYTSGAVASYQYSYSASGLGALTSEGYKTAMIKVTPTTGGATITGLDLGRRNSAISVNASNPWLDLQINIPAVTAGSTFITGGSVVNSEYLQRCVVIALGAVTSLASCFQYSYALQSVTWPSGSLTSVTDLTSCFQSCYALQSVTWPSGSLTAVTTTTSAFASCPSLADIENCAIPVSFSVANCNLSAANLNAIYTSLPTVVSATITRTGNVGAGAGGENTSIATAKNWTVA